MIVLFIKWSGNPQNDRLTSDSGAVPPCVYTLYLILQRLEREHLSRDKAELPVQVRCVGPLKDEVEKYIRRFMWVFICPHTHTTVYFWMYLFSINKLSVLFINRKMSTYFTSLFLFHEVNEWVTSQPIGFEHISWIWNDCESFSN